MNSKEFMSSKEMSEFTKRCLTDKYFKADVFADIWEKSQSFSEFAFNCFNDSRVNNLQGTGELSKESYEFNKQYLNIISKDKIKYTVISDRGGILLGNDVFNVLVPNGYGDCETTVVILEDGEFSDSALNYFTMIEGEFNLYMDDCHAVKENILTTLKGRFFIYYKNKYVFIAKLKG